MSRAGLEPGIRSTALSGNQYRAMEVPGTPAMGRLTSSEELQVLDGPEGDPPHGIPGSQASIVHVDDDVLSACGLGEGGDAPGS